MKKTVKFIFLFVLIYTFPFVVVNAGGKSDDSTNNNANVSSNEPAKPLTCVYGPSGKTYYRLIQTADGQINLQMSHVDNINYTDMSSQNWGGDRTTASSQTILKKTKNFEQTSKYVNGHLTGCPEYLLDYGCDKHPVKCVNVYFTDEKEGNDRANSYDLISYLPKVFETESVPNYFNDPSSSYEGLEPITECTALLGDPGTDGTPAFYLVKAFHVIKYVALVLLIVLSVIDFTSATAKQDKDAMAKLLKKIMMRFILCIIIFLLPYLVKLLLKYLVSRQTDLCKGNW